MAELYPKTFAAELQVPNGSFVAFGTSSGGYTLARHFTRYCTLLNILWSPSNLYQSDLLSFVNRRANNTHAPCLY